MKSIQNQFCQCGISSDLPIFYKKKFPCIHRCSRLVRQQASHVYFAEQRKTAKYIFAKLFMRKYISKTWFALTCFVTIWKVIFKKLCKSNFKKDTQRGDWKRSVFFLNFEEVNFCALQTFLAFLTELPGINYTAQFSYCFNNYLPTFALFDLIWLLNLKKRSTIKTNFLWSTIETKSTRSQVEKDRFAELMVCREWKIIFWRKTFLCLCVQKKTFGKFWKYQYFF